MRQVGFVPAVRRNDAVVRFGVDDREYLWSVDVGAATDHRGPPRGGVFRVFCRRGDVPFPSFMNTTTCFAGSAISWIGDRIAVDQSRPTARVTNFARRRAQRDGSRHV